MSTEAMNDSEEYYCFRVKESVDSELGADDENIVIPCSHNFDLKKLRTELWKQFGIPRDRRIFYIDDDGDDVPIDSECEFHEALKLARNAFVVNTAIPLIVGSFHVPTCSDDEQYSGTSEICYPNLCSDEKKSRSINNNPISFFNKKNDDSMSELNLEFDKQKRPTRKIPSNQKKLDIKQRDESNEEQIESEDMEISRKLSTSLQCHPDTVPPPWFIKYMEAMKKDMVSAITHEVAKNVTEMLNKHLDSFAYPPLKEFSQSRSQSYSSLSKQHPKHPSFDSNEKNQKKMRSQDEEQSSDASIERVDEPQNVNITEDPQTKTDMISTISQEVVKEMTEMLNRMDPLTSVPSKKLNKSQSQSHVPSSKRFSRHLDSQSSEKNQRKMRLQDGEQSSDDASEHTYKPRHANTSNISRQLRKKLKLIEDANVLKEQKRKNKHHQWINHVVDNLNNDIEKEQSTQSDARENFAPRKNLQDLLDPIAYNEIPKTFEKDLRMNCSVTGHQILDEGHRTGDVRYCDNSDIDRTNFWSCDQEEEDDAFEIIQMPAFGNRNESFTHLKELVIEQRRNDSNRDSPSFELLSESPSPTPTCPMHFNEEHFSANEGNAEQQFSQFVNTNLPSCIYVIDVHGKIYNDHQLADLDKHVNVDLEKRSGGAYSFVTETLPVQDTHCSKSSRSEQQSSERKNSRDNMSDNASSTYDDVRNSHTSYLTVRTHCDSKAQCSCQSQTDSNDFTQSFHSHTTSVTDTTDIYTEACDNDRYNKQMSTTAKNVGEAATATRTTTSRNDHDVCADNMGEIKTNERHYNNADDLKCFYDSYSSTPRGISIDPSYQSSRASGSSDRLNSNKSRKTFVQTQLSTVDPIFILPETLVTVVNSYVYDTVREIRQMLNKIRVVNNLHTKKDSAKHRGGMKRDD